MGAFDATTSVTDGVTDNLAQYHNELKTAADHAMSAAAYAAYGTPASMTGNVTLTDASLPILSYAPTAARDLTLPAVATTNHAFYVINRSGTYAITVKDAAAATITTVAINATAFLVSDGANSWYLMGGGVASDITLALTHAATSKNPPIDADELPLLDSATSFSLKKLTWLSLKATLKTYFDTLYSAILTKAAASDVTTGTDDAKYVTSKAIKDSVNVPNVAPSTSGNVLTSNGTAWTSAVADGWTSISATGTSGTLDAPSFEISFNADMTGIIGLGDRIKITQATTKYFIVTKVGAFGGGATIITCYGGTDYTLVATATTAITAPYLSHAKNPFGFPATPSKWSVSVSDSTDRTRTNPVATTWYYTDLGSINISVPIGVWGLEYHGALWASSAAAQTIVGMKASLSTSNNSESDSGFTMTTFAQGASSSLAAGFVAYNKKTITLTSKTVYYLIGKTDYANIATIVFYNASVCPFTIIAVCAYL